MEVGEHDGRGDQHRRLQLNNFLQQKSEQRHVTAKAKFFKHEINLRTADKSNDEDAKLAEFREKLRLGKTNPGKLPLSNPNEDTIVPRDLGPNTVVHVAPYDLEGTWRTHQGNEYFALFEASRALGQMSSSGLTSGGNDDDFATCTSGVGVTFYSSQGDTILLVGTNLGMSYDQYSFRANSHAFVGIHVDQYTAAGDLVATAVYQQISLWD
jgi:hypothetical protein